MKVPDIFPLRGGGGLLIPIPEPSTMVLLLFGPLIVLSRRRLGGGKSVMD